MKVGTRDFNALRVRLEDLGMPEVLAFMAAERAQGIPPFNTGRQIEKEDFDGLFLWSLTPEDSSFWIAVDEELNLLPVLNKQEELS